MRMMHAQAAMTPPACSADGIATSKRRFYDVANAVWLVKVFPGEFYVSNKKDEVLVTVLGSCVSACIRDCRGGFGGMNHFLLPEGESRDGQGDSARYGNFAMEKLINELIKQGCPRERMEAKVFGGASVIESSIAVGSRNTEFVLRFLQEEGIACVAHDLGGLHPRRIQYEPTTGRVVRRLLQTGESALIAREEKNYAGRLSSVPTAGDIELFGERT